MRLKPHDVCNKEHDKEISHYLAKENAQNPLKKQLSGLAEYKYLCGSKTVRFACCGVCSVKASSAFFLKTVRRTVFTSLRSARSPSNPLSSKYSVSQKSFTHRKKHPLVSECFWRRTSAFAIPMPSVLLASACAVSKHHLRSP